VEAIASIVMWSEATFFAEAFTGSVNGVFHSPLYFGDDHSERIEWKITLMPGQGGQQKFQLYRYTSCRIYIDSINVTDIAGSFNPGGVGEVRMRMRNADVDSPTWVEIPLSNYRISSAPNSKFSLTVTFRVERKAPEPDTSQPLATLSADFEKLFLEDETSDVGFEIGSQIIPAHKLVLTARIPFFKTLFASGMKESKTNRIRIDDADAASFKQVLKFVYCGKFPDDLEDVADSVLPITEKYDIQELKEACANALGNRLRQDNIVATLVLADRYRCPELKKECFKHLAKWKKCLDKDALELLMSYPDLMKEAFQNA